MHRNDLIALCSTIVGISSAVSIGSPLADALDTVTLGHGKFALAALAIAGVVAGQVLRILNAPAQAAPAAPVAEGK